MSVLSPGLLRLDVTTIAPTNRESPIAMLVASVLSTRVVGTGGWMGLSSHPATATAIASNNEELGAYEERRASRPSDLQLTACASR